MDVTKKIATISLSLALASLPAVAWTQIEQERVDDDIERIEIVATKVDTWSRLEFKNEVFKLEKQFYSMYNQLTQDPMLKVRCSKKPKEGTRSILISVCEPAYNYKLSVALNSKDDRDALAGRMARQQKMEKYKKKQLKHVTSLLKSNDVLRQKMEKYMSLNKEYEEMLSSSKED